ncbi:MAG: hypothetical protein AAFY72_02060 [Cyanobacteria bacterium J06649_4]
MKTAILLPDSVYEEAETLSQQLGLSLNELYTKALKDYLERHSREQRLNKLNEVYGQESSQLDPVISKMQYMSLPQEDW